MPRYTKAEQERKNKEQAEACATLRKLLPVGASINIICTEVSRSGSTSNYKVLLGTNDAIESGILMTHETDKPTIEHWRNTSIRDISWLVAQALNRKRSNNGAIESSGWGLSRSYQIVYSLGHALYPNGVACTGDDNCASNDHNNGDRDYTKGKIHKDGGYAYRENKL